MRHLGHWAFTIIALCAAIQAVGADYYVDAGGGDDSNPGNTPATAWRTLDKVNQTIFAPGDHIYLAAGSRWVGQLHPQGSGAEGAPITLSAHGEGARPVIDGAGATGGAVFALQNQSYWELSGLELTNDAQEPGDRRGVRIGAANAGLVRHVYLKDLYIHNIKGITGQTIQAKNTGGIGVFLDADDARDTRFDDLRIEGCRIETVDNTGIWTISLAEGSNETTGPNWQRRRITGLHIRGNRVNDIGKNAMIIRMAGAGLIEHNICWDTAYRTGTGNTMFSRSSKDTVFQYNEGYLNRSRDYDGSMYDADLDSPGCIFQYSYSHDNNHGLFWMCTTENDANVIVRYNISQNDKGNIFCINYANKSCYIYNNVVYIPAHLSPTIIDERRNADKTYYFYNNVIYNLSPTAKYNWKNGKRHFSNNLFYGQHPEGEPDDSQKLTADPRFVSPGSGKFGIGSLDGYKLQAGSPCIDTGWAVPGFNGTDYWGNAVPRGTAPDRGAQEFQER